MPLSDQQRQRLELAREFHQSLVEAGRSHTEREIDVILSNLSRRDADFRNLCIQEEKFCPFTGRDYSSVNGGEDDVVVPRKIRFVRPSEAYTEFIGLIEAKGWTDKLPTERDNDLELKAFMKAYGFDRRQVKAKFDYYNRNIRGNIGEGAAATSTTTSAVESLYQELWKRAPDVLMIIQHIKTKEPFFNRITTSSFLTFETLRSSTWFRDLFDDRMHLWSEFARKIVRALSRCLHIPHDASAYAGQVVVEHLRSYCCWWVY